jgi:hypothetical protein
MDLYEFLNCYYTRIGVLDDAKVVFLLHVLDPLAGLALRVDHQRPAASVGNDHSVVNRKLKTFLIF